MITVTFNGASKEEVTAQAGTIISFAFADLYPAIMEIVRLRPDEIIDGLVIDGDPVMCRAKIRRKPGRKAQ